MQPRRLILSIVLGLLAFGSTFVVKTLQGDPPARPLAAALVSEQHEAVIVAAESDAPAVAGRVLVAPAGRTPALSGAEGALIPKGSHLERAADGTVWAVVTTN